MWRVGTRVETSLDPAGKSARATGRGLVDRGGNTVIDSNWIVGHMAFYGYFAYFSSITGMSEFYGWYTLAGRLV
jgi:hypothetical protein